MTRWDVTKHEGDARRGKGVMTKREDISFLITDTEFGIILDIYNLPSWFSTVKKVETSDGVSTCVVSIFVLQEVSYI